MRIVIAFGVAALLTGVTLSAGAAENPNTEAPAQNPPAAVSNRLGGAAIKPVPNAKPTEGLVIPPFNPVTDQKPRQPDNR